MDIDEEGEEGRGQDMQMKENSLQNDKCPLRSHNYHIRRNYRENVPYPNSETINDSQRVLVFFCARTLV